jgi:hypothetical protein
MGGKERAVVTEDLGIPSETEALIALSEDLDIQLQGVQRATEGRFSLSKMRELTVGRRDALVNDRVDQIASMGGDLSRIGDSGSSATAHPLLLKPAVVTATLSAMEALFLDISAASGPDLGSPAETRRSDSAHE